MVNREPSGETVGSYDPGTVPENSLPPEIRKRHIERDRGGLTSGDREFLMDREASESLNAQTIRNRRYRIRKRIVNSMKDFEVAARWLPASDRKSVFESLHESNRDYLKEIGVFLYLGFQDLGAGKKRFLKEVIEEAERRRGRDVSIKVTSELGDAWSYCVEMEDVPSASTEAD